jgi:hypothetical protein
MNSASMRMVVMQIIKSFGDKGCTNADIAKEIAKSHKQWKPTSVSPQVAGLLRTTCIRAEGDRLNRRVFFVRDLTHGDEKKILKSHRKHKTETSTSVPKMLLEVGENQTLTLTFDEAKELYKQFGKIFNGGK